MWEKYKFNKGKGRMIGLWEVMGILLSYIRGWEEDRLLGLGGR